MKPYDMKPWPRRSELQDDGPLLCPKCGSDDVGWEEDKAYRTPDVAAQHGIVVDRRGMYSDDPEGAHHRLYCGGCGTNFEAPFDLIRFVEEG